MLNALGENHISLLAKIQGDKSMMAETRNTWELKKKKIISTVNFYTVYKTGGIGKIVLEIQESALLSCMFRDQLPQKLCR